MTTHYLEWSCLVCSGEHNVTIPEVEIRTVTLPGTDFVVDHGVAITGRTMDDYEITIRLPRPMDLSCPLRGVVTSPTRHLTSGSIWDYEVQRKIRSAIEYTVLDPDERDALVRAIQREMRIL